MVHRSADGSGHDDHNDEELMAESESAIEESFGLSPAVLFNPVIPQDAKYCTQDAADIVGLKVWQFRRAVRLGLIEDSDNYHWPKSVLTHVFADRRSILQAVKIIDAIDTDRSADSQLRIAAAGSDEKAAPFWRILRVGVFNNRGISA